MVKLSMKPFEWIVYIIISVGAVNLGLDKLVNFNFVDWLLTLVGLVNYSLYVYGIIGIAGAYAIYKIWY